ncbi:hypothetical protein [Pelagicoccus sp. SDUM812003]|uniref:hypothetical protein n=1 Tax=Pelagicoccus sp. SDUM812003 TaxID=3041267 RepID=UPI00280EC37B|nr:hypothetical protein [Pelagicoccus sp. SDUM812003]MDQ8202403.1 hypothetical protein [Pelagicoccus sp. SDUM812003]
MMNASRRIWVLCFLLLAGFLSACGMKKDYEVGGAEALSDENADASVVYRVIEYPVTEYELDYLQQAMDRLQGVVPNHPEIWSSIQSSDDPVAAAQRNAVWKDAELNGEDVLAVTMKLTFLREFSDQRGETEGLRENLRWLEGRLKDRPEDEELSSAAQGIRQLIKAIEILERSGSFDFYVRNQEAMDAALDRFRSIGEQ